jgi:hypothetical protein
MGSPRLILVPQLRVHMRYQEWWPRVLQEWLAPHFSEVITLGDSAVHVPSEGSFTLEQAAAQHEMRQVDEYLRLKLQDDDVLLHCDLSYPGLFHSSLFLKRPNRTVCICHATARNRYDIWERVPGRIHFEDSIARLYDCIVVASEYHANKLPWDNTVNVGCLPDPPVEMLPQPLENKARAGWVSVSRGAPQKCNPELEQLVEQMLGMKIARCSYNTWENYYHFLDGFDYLLSTAREETYGYQIRDALLRWVVPIAPRAYSYPELLPDCCLYATGGSVEEQAHSIARVVLALEDNPISIDTWKELRADRTPRFFEQLIHLLRQ